MTVLVDTNVLISAFVFDGLPRKLLHRMVNDGHVVIVTSYIRQEFFRIIRQKWPGIADSARESFLSSEIHFLKSTGKKLGTLRDEKDIPILSDALYYDIGVILTGDRDFLEAGLKHPAVMSPTMLWEYLDRIG